MSYSEYRIKAIQWLWKKYDMAGVSSLPTFSRFRIDDICADHWKRNDSVLKAVLELENHIVNELHVRRI